MCYYVIKWSLPYLSFVGRFLIRAMKQMHDKLEFETVAGNIES